MNDEKLGPEDRPNPFDKVNFQAAWAQLQDHLEYQAKSTKAHADGLCRSLVARYGGTPDDVRSIVNARFYAGKEEGLREALAWMYKRMREEMEWPEADEPPVPSELDAEP